MNGGLPLKLLRFYSEKKWAETLISEGAIRLHRQQHFKKTFDETRGDATEGDGRLKIKNQPLTTVSFPSGRQGSTIGDVDWSTSNLNPRFLFCTAQTTADVARLKAKWPYGIEIIDPARFKDELEKAAKAATPVGSQIHPVEGHPIVYDKGREILSAPRGGEFHDLAYTQKPAEYSYEGEFRYFVSFNPENIPEDLMHIDVKLSRPSEYLRKMDEWG